MTARWKWNRWYVAAAVVVAVIAGWMLLGMGLVVVQSDAVSQSVSRGTLMVTHRVPVESLHAGDVVSISLPSGEVLTRRVESIDATGETARVSVSSDGSPEQISFMTDHVSVAWLSIPVLGGVLVGWGPVILLLGVLAVLCFFGWRYFRTGHVWGSRVGSRTGRKPSHRRAPSLSPEVESYSVLDDEPDYEPEFELELGFEPEFDSTVAEALTPAPAPMPAIPSAQSPVMPVFERSEWGESSSFRSALSALGSAAEPDAVESQALPAWSSAFKPMPALPWEDHALEDPAPEDSAPARDAVAASPLDGEMRAADAAVDDAMRRLDELMARLKAPRSVPDIGATHREFRDSYAPSMESSGVVADDVAVPSVPSLSSAQQLPSVDDAESTDSDEWQLPSWRDAIDRPGFQGRRSATEGSDGDV